MGEKANRKRLFLIEHPHCCYCGEPAATEDHCPPRCFFPKRNWPETFLFPSCGPCNAQNRLDEQLLAVLVRIKLKEDKAAAANSTEWGRLFDGVRNNQPEVAQEWMSIGPSEMKRSFREAYGKTGDDLRIVGFGMIRLGPLTRAAVTRFIIKLGQALYYKHCRKILRGAVIARHVDPKDLNEPLSESVRNFVNMVPRFNLPSRNKQSLAESFMYRYNFNEDVGALLALVRFSEQMNFLIMAMEQSMSDKLVALSDGNGEQTTLHAVPARLPAGADAVL